MFSEHVNRKGEGQKEGLGDNSEAETVGASPSGHSLVYRTPVFSGGGSSPTLATNQH